MPSPGNYEHLTSDLVNSKYSVPGNPEIRSKAERARKMKKAPGSQRKQTYGQGHNPMTAEHMLGKGGRNTGKY